MRPCDGSGELDDTDEPWGDGWQGASGACPGCQECEPSHSCPIDTDVGFCPGCETERDGPPFVLSAGQESRIVETVDDILAYLRSDPDPRLRFLEASTGPADSRFPDRWMSVSFVHDDRWTVSTHGPTMLAACQDAKRLIVEAKQTGRYRATPTPT